MDRNRSTFSTKMVVTDDHSIALALIAKSSETLAAIAWPISAVIIALLFRSEMSTLLARLKSLKIFGLEASLDSFIKEQLNDPLNTVPVTGAPPPIDTAPSELVSDSPVSLIVSKWLEVSKALEVALGLPHGASKLTLKEKLAQLSSISGVATDLPLRIASLKRVRDRVAKAPTLHISNDSLRLFEANTRQIIDDLDKIHQN